MEPFKYRTVIKIEGTDYSAQAESFSYIDESDGASDSISVTLSDVSGKWHGSKMPGKASQIIARIKMNRRRECG